MRNHKYKKFKEQNKREMAGNDEEDFVEMGKGEGEVKMAKM